MTTNSRQIPDALLRQALRELADGPESGALSADVLRVVDITSQERRMWRVLPIPPRAVMIGLAALLLLGLVAALILGAGFHESTLPGPARLPAIVVEQWNHLEGAASRVAHIGFAPRAEAAMPIGARLPVNAVGLRWSPDGERLAYFAAEDRPAHLSRHGLVSTGLYVARTDGADPTPVRLPRSLDQYIGSMAGDGSAMWAPGGRLFALAWSTSSCSDGTDCIPPSGLDVFDAAGNLVKTIDTVDGFYWTTEAIWSPDGLGLGWLSGTCQDSYCSSDAFHWQRVDANSPAITFAIGDGRVVWSADGLLHGVSVHTVSRTIGDGTDFNTTLGSVYTVRSDGADLRDLRWTTDHPHLIPRWSPDGRLLATIDSKAGSLTIHYVATARDVVVSVPAGLDIATWAPDSGWIVLLGGVDANASAYAFHVVNADGTGFVSLGEGEDFAWAPSAVVAAP